MDESDKIMKLLTQVIVSESTSVSTASTFSTAVPGVLRLADMERVIRRIESLPEPFKDLMKERGCDPKDGWTLVIPAGSVEYPDHLPPYVRASHFVCQPVCIKADQSFVIGKANVKY